MEKGTIGQLAEGKTDADTGEVEGAALSFTPQGEGLVKPPEQ